MKNESAFPTLDYFGNQISTSNSGMTLREWYAGLAMQAIRGHESLSSSEALVKCAKKESMSVAKYISKMAIENADALIKELEK